MFLKLASGLTNKQTRCVDVTKAQMPKRMTCKQRGLEALGCSCAGPEANPSRVAAPYEKSDRWALLSLNCWWLGVLAQGGLLHGLETLCLSTCLCLQKFLLINTRNGKLLPSIV